MNTILAVRDLGISFGGNAVLKSINFEVYEQEVLGIMGPNGAGKTVLLNIISGILKADHGEIEFLGQDIRKKKITERTNMGIGRTFQVPRAFEHMSVYENILSSAVYGKNISGKLLHFDLPCDIIQRTRRIFCRFIYQMASWKSKDFTVVFCSCALYSSNVAKKSANWSYLLVRRTTLVW